MSEKKYMVFAHHSYHPDGFVECRVKGRSQESRFFTEEEAMERVETFGGGPYKIFELVERTVQLKKGLA